MVWWRNHAVIHECVTRFDFPIEQAVPAKTMFARCKEKSCNLSPHATGEKPLDESPRNGQNELCGRALLHSPTHESQKHACDRDNRLQRDTRDKCSANPQKQRDDAGPEKPRETAVLDDVQPRITSRDEQSDAKTTE